MAVNVAALVQNALKTAGATVSGLTTTVVYTRAGGSATYDPDTGVVSTSGAATYTVTAVLTDYQEREIDGQAVRRFDRKALIAYKDLPVIPALDDTVTIDGIVWAIKGARLDPTRSLHTLQIRKP